MLSFPNCKINLGLYIVGRREDGYHDLETIYYPLPLKDVLEIVPSKSKGRYTGTGLTVQGAPETNLVWKALELMKSRFPGKIPELDVFLHKTIPMGAGLGGGSSDAAFMLRLLNDYNRLGLDNAALEEMALELGSDCPFFIRNSPQYAAGRGEIMEPVNLDLSGFSFQLVCPEIHVSTATAFSKIKPASAAFDLKELPSLPVIEWKEHIANDFEKIVFGEHPELEDIRLQLYNAGALYASMSGSGSAIYGIFPKGKHAKIETKAGVREYYL